MIVPFDRDPTLLSTVIVPFTQLGPVTNPECFTVLLLQANKKGAKKTGNPDLEANIGGIVTELKIHKKEEV